MKVFLCETIHPKALALLKQNAEIISDEARMGEVDALINRCLHIGRKELEKMPNLKVIAIHGTGTDGVDLAAAKERGVQVVYAPHLNANAVAELIVGLALAVNRRIVFARQLIDTDRQEEGMALLNGFELKGKTFGVLGAGAIAGRAAAIMKNGFDMRVVGWSRSLTPQKAEKLGMECAASAEEVIRQADVLALGIPLNDATRGMIDREQLAKMKPTACLINTARGPLVNEQDLYEALKNGVIAGAACDVFSQEPPQKENPLLSLPNFVATPHIGANTDEALYTVGMACVTQILDVLAGKSAEYPL